MERREILLHEIVNYIDGVETEHRVQMRTTLPSVEEYWSYRMASSAVRFVLCATEYVPTKFNV